MTDDPNDVGLLLSGGVLLVVIVILYLRRRIPGAFALAIGLSLVSGLVTLGAVGGIIERAPTSLVAAVLVLLLLGAAIALVIQIRTWRAQRPGG